MCGIAALEAAALAVVVDGRAALRMPDGAEALTLGWRAPAATVVGFLCWYAAVQRIGAERATLFSGVIPVAAALSAPVAGVGAYGPAQAGGTLLVAAGVALGSGLFSSGDGGTPAKRAELEEIRAGV